MSESIFFDITGRADCYNSIPLLAMKSAKFLSLAGTLYDLKRIVVNNVKYDIEETAMNGAVALDSSYRIWSFIAPNDRLDFDDYFTMTLGDGLHALRDAISIQPIVPWDKFVEWLSVHGSSIAPNAAGVTYVLTPISSNNIQINGNPISFEGLTGFPSFIDALHEAFSDAHSYAMSEFVVGNRNFGFALTISVPASDGNIQTIRLEIYFRE